MNNVIGIENIAFFMKGFKMKYLSRRKVTIVGRISDTGCFWNSAYDIGTGTLLSLLDRLGIQNGSTSLL